MFFRIYSEKSTQGQTLCSGAEARIKMPVTHAASPGATRRHTLLNRYVFFLQVR